MGWHKVLEDRTVNHVLHPAKPSFQNEGENKTAPEDQNQRIHLGTSSPSLREPNPREERTSARTTLVNTEGSINLLLTCHFFSWLTYKTAVLGNHHKSLWQQAIHRDTICMTIRKRGAGGSCAATTSPRTTDVTRVPPKLDRYTLTR